MSFFITVPRAEDNVFESATYDAKASPRLDGRTKVGKRQLVFDLAGRAALVDLAYTLGDGPKSGTIVGHVNPDLSGSLTITIVSLSDV